MSRLVEYSKFDHLTEDSDDESHENNDNANKNGFITKETTTKTAYAAPVKQSDNETKKNVGGIIKRDEISRRYRFEYNGRTVYEFEQSLDDLTIYVLPPPYVTKGRQINCIISANHFKLGLVGHGGGGSESQCQWFLNEGTFGTVDVDESTWTLEDYDGDGDDSGKNNKSDRRKIIAITLIKANRGTIWEAALRGNPVSLTTMDPISKEQVKKDLMIQRFQEENPGFDFSGADFNGSIPDARDFMGGVKYQ